MFFTSEDKPLLLENHFKGKTCFLVLSGPSLNSLDLGKMKQPGIITFGVNNVVKAFRPNMWTMVDDVQNFMISTYLDPKIMKFIPLPKHSHTLFDNTTWQESAVKVQDCPNVVYYKRNDAFNADTYLTEDTINWGNSKDLGGGRSVMLAAIRIIYLLGFRTVYLVGADFSMSDTKKYAFEQDRTAGSIKCNNSTYRKLNERFAILRPKFEAAGFQVFNSTFGSGLTAFDYVPYAEAVKLALQGFPDTLKETSAGMYDRSAKLRDAENRKTHGIIYYNSGKSCLVRLAVSISSLRKVTDWPTTILCDAASYDDCIKIGNQFNVDVKIADMAVNNRNDALLNRCLLHKYTPYKTNIYIDADTLILKDAFLKLHKEADRFGFVLAQFADWTPKTGVIAKRIAEWSNITDTRKAMDYLFAINCGVFAFKTDSKLMADWYDFARKGDKFFIPDEVGCQIMLPDYPHNVVDSSFNLSCKFGRITKRTKIIHYHGRKHCRIENGVYLHKSDLWYAEFDKIKHFPCVAENVQYDKALVENLGRRL